VFAVYPDLSSRHMEVKVDAINSSLGTQLPAAQVRIKNFQSSRSHKAWYLTYRHAAKAIRIKQAACRSCPQHEKHVLTTGQRPCAESRHADDVHGV
jgi:hypothetical protein